MWLFNSHCGNRVRQKFPIFCWDNHQDKTSHMFMSRARSALLCIAKSRPEKRLYSKPTMNELYFQLIYGLQQHFDNIYDIIFFCPTAASPLLLQCYSKAKPPGFRKGMDCRLQVEDHSPKILHFVILFVFTFPKRLQLWKSPPPQGGNRVQSLQSRIGWTNGSMCLNFFLGIHVIVFLVICAKGRTVQICKNV